MMKFGCCLTIGSFVPQVESGQAPHDAAATNGGRAAREPAMPTPTISEELERSFAILSANGYDFAELTVGTVANLSDDEYAAVKKIIEEAPIPVPVYNSFVPASIPLTGPDVSLPAVEAYLEQSMSRVAGAGGRMIIFGSGAARSVPDGFSMGAGEKQIEDFLYLCDSFAAKHNLAVAIEPLNNRESNVINTVSGAVRLARKLDLPHIRVLADSYHMFMEKEPYDVFEEAGSLLAHVHISDRDRAYPGKLAELHGNANARLDDTPADGEPGEAEGSVDPEDRSAAPADYDAIDRPADRVDFRNFFAALRTAGYNELISTECPFDNFEAETKKSLEYIRRAWN